MDSPNTPRPLRADARRNRERVLAAAREAFAAEGISVPLDEIARRAGVGPGTVYRHFPTKEALFHAAILDNMERTIARARELSAAADPGSAFFEFLGGLLAESTVKRDLADAVGGNLSAQSGADAAHGQLSPEFVAPQKTLVALIGSLLHRAQDCGAVRPDLAVDDLMLVLKGAFMATAQAAGDEQRRRAFAVILDGLRAR
ncbi:TetR/AcrR family transcriptional regulator [Nocardia stercoris]|uniref:TetR/AcrR family transcriptional regulator n=1 Tax=Nocardia stercoris TaxID=2483361 RepID=A0A3M2L4D8_9NOCA|nr:TetR/AcrR family transcriptional regulator [Nocardia stercoris]